MIAGQAAPYALKTPVKKRQDVKNHLREIPPSEQPHDLVLLPRFLAVPQCHEKEVGAGSRVFRISTSITNDFGGTKDGPAGMDYIRCLCLLLAQPDTRALSRAVFAAKYRDGIPDTETKAKVTGILLSMARTSCRLTPADDEGLGGKCEFPLVEPLDRLPGGGLSFPADPFRIRISSQFRALLAAFAALSPQQLIPVHVPSLLSLSSDFAARIYLELASDAMAHNSDAPLKVSTRKIWSRVGFKSPRFASKMWVLLTQNSKSMLYQLDGLLIGAGERIMHVSIDQKARGHDPMLTVWSEKHKDCFLR